MYLHPAFEIAVAPSVLDASEPSYVAKVAQRAKQPHDKVALMKCGSEN